MYTLWSITKSTDTSDKKENTSIIVLKTMLHKD